MKELWPGGEGLSQGHLPSEQGARIRTPPGCPALSRAASPNVTNGPQPRPSPSCKAQGWGHHALLSRVPPPWGREGHAAGSTACHIPPAHTSCTPKPAQLCHHLLGWSPLRQTPWCCPQGLMAPPSLWAAMGDGGRNRLSGGREREGSTYRHRGPAPGAGHR